MRRNFGYRLRGETAFGRSGLLPRGQRVSALCSYDVNGFIDWEMTDGTYDRDGFLDAAERVVVRAAVPHS